MTEAEIAWLKTADSEGRLNLEAGELAGVNMRDFMNDKLIREDGPVWLVHGDMRITDKGRAAIK